MFDGCESLISIDLSNFSTKSLKNVTGIFQNCKNLKYVDISTFKNSEIDNMGSLFTGCSSLTSIDISNFINEKVTNLKNIFAGCSNLTYINLNNIIISDRAILSNFIDNSLKNPIVCIDKKFFNKIVSSYDCSLNCTSWGEYIEKINNDSNSCESGCLFSLYENDCYKICSYNFYYNETINRYMCTNNEECPESHSKSIAGKKECVISCNDTKEHKYEFNNKCYKKCSTIRDYNCIPDCTREAPYLWTNNLTCISKCSTIQQRQQICVRTYFIDINEEIKILLKTYTNDTMKSNEKILFLFKNGYLEEILEQMLFDNSSIIMNETNAVHQIIFLSNQKNENISSINFGYCEEILKSHYGINDEELVMYKIDYKVNEFKIPIIEYGLFNQNGSIRLNLSLCNNITSEYKIPVSIDNDKLYIYDPSSDYYTDKCSKYSSEGSADMTLYEKKNIFNNENLALCESKCTYIGYNFTISNALCDCAIKSEMTYSEDADINNLLNKISNDKSNSNLDVTQCLDVFTSPEKIKTNSGFLTIAIILVIFIIVFIIFCIKGKNSLENKIDEIIYKKFTKKENKTKGNKKKSKSKINNKITSSKNKFNKSKIITRKDSDLIKIRKRNLSKKIWKKKSTKSTTFNRILETNNKNSKNKKNKSSPNDNKPDPENDYELNTLSYQNALKYEKRTCCEYYFSLIKNKQIIFFTFCSFNDYNSGIIRKMIFFLSFALHYTINALFFNDSNMHQIYEDEGKFNYSYQYPKILISAASSTIILRIMLHTLVLTDKDILQVKLQQTKPLAITKKKEILKCINIKFAIFFILNFILLVLFGFYLTCFNGTYEKTQIYLLENTFISFGFSLAYPFIINIFPSAIRTSSLNNKKDDKSCLYKASQVMQLL